MEPHMPSLIRKLPSFSIPIKLALAFFFAAMIPAIIAVVFVFNTTTESTIQNAHIHLESMSEAHNDVLEAHIKSLESAAAAIAEAPVIREYLLSLNAPDPTANSEQVEHAQLAEELVHHMQERLWGQTHHIFLLNTAGRVVLSPPHGEYDTPCRMPCDNPTLLRTRLGSHIGDELHDAEWFENALVEPWITSFSDFGDRDHFHQLVLHLVHDKNGQPLGAIAIEVAIDEVIRFLTHDFKLGETGRLQLFTRDGRPVVHSKKDQYAPIPSPGLAQTIESGETHIGDYTTADNRKIYGIYLPSSVYPWIISVEIDQAEVLAPVIHQRNQTAAMLGGISLLIALAGVCIGLWFGLPLRRCAKAARQIADGDLQSHIPVTRSGDEIAILQCSIESMRNRLIDHIHNLDDQVAQRTTELATANHKLLATKERYELAVVGSRDAIWDWDLVSNSFYYARRWTEMLGITSDELTAEPIPDLWLSAIHPEDTDDFNEWLAEIIVRDTGTYECEFRLIHPDKSSIWALCRAAAVRDHTGRANRLLGSLADITEMKQAQQALADAALTDKLTGLANKARFRDRLEETLARTKRSGELCAILFFDFDRFKVVNDSLGHNVGDALLVSIADRFRSICRDSDLPSRFGGDEFVVLLENLKSPDEAQAAADRFLKVFAEPHEVMEHKVSSTASIGLVTNELAYDSPDDMIRDADAAMYQAKAQGRGCAVTFDVAMHEQAQRRLRLEEELRLAIPRKQLRLVYQPIVDLNTGQAAGVEALLRWTHPEFGIVSPVEFIPVAEDSGIIIDLGWWVLDKALARCAAWHHDGLDITNLPININVSKRQLLSDNFVAGVRERLAHHNVPPQNLKIEVTETTVVDNRAGIAPLLQELRDTGVLIAMDDFGTGHSSLSGLHLLPLDVIKIDQSFVRGCSQNAELLSIIGAIINLGENLGMKTVAEGLETIEHVAAMQSMGCTYGQGYFFARPLEEPDFIQFVKKSHGNIADAA